MELGTEATRTGIIDNACKSAYIALKKDVYHILPDGEYLIEALSQLGIIMDKYKTSQLGQSLKKVFRGECTINDSVGLAEKEIQAVFDIAKDVETNIGIVGEHLGTCPLCGSEIINGRKSYYCSGYKDGCAFSIWKYICKKAISVTHAKALLANGKTSKLSGFVSKSNKTFDAVLKLDENGKVIFDFS